MTSLLIAGVLMAGPWEAAPDVVAAKKKGRPDFGWSEADVPEYTLPPVIDAEVTAENWDERRREIVAMLATEMFGHVPADLKTAVKVSRPEAANGVDAVHRVITVTATHRTKSVTFTADVYSPANVDKPAPAFILIDHREVSDDTPADGPESEGFWPVAEIVSRGYATAAFHCDPIAPDRKDAHGEGVHGMFDRPGDTEWGTLAAWAWASSRVLDGFETIDEIDATRVGVIGHSRGGKTALWATANDERFAIGVSNESGCGGAALSRRRIGETVARINTVFPYWFNGRFKTYNDREADLPFDQHTLISTIAPRAVYVASADEDLWADPRGEYTSLREANPVFALIGDSELPDAMPALDEQVIAGRRGYHIRQGAHNLTSLDWDRVLTFSDTVFSRE